MDEIKKNIDESWKETVEKEKEALKKENKFVPPEPDFNFFVTTLAIQASISLGQVPNPATNKTEEDLNQAKFIIDTLGMLKEKTKGNLSSEETNLLENLLYELRMQYIAKTRQKGEADDRQRTT
ncbi:MAG: DUF1844 domain-containing protein [Candidatus Omnitrophica bacterium]|nr:DUF1844 domain-containing protein [Candidatus Omnitrophota bacterium]